MILVDTSVWIGFFRGEKTRQTEILEKSIRSGRSVATCGIVLTEVLAGVQSDHQAREVLDLFGRLTMLSMDDQVYVSAADLYRSAKKSGRTVRRVVDCMIAACATAHSSQLLHHDRDFDTLASVSKLKIA